MKKGRLRNIIKQTNMNLGVHFLVLFEVSKDLTFTWSFNKYLMGPSQESHTGLGAQDTL